MVLITEDMSSNMLSFFKKKHEIKRLHIDGADVIANCKG